MKIIEIQYRRALTALFLANDHEPTRCTEGADHRGGHLDRAAVQRDQLVHGVRPERRLARHEVKERGPERVDVRAVVDRLAARARRGLGYSIHYFPELAYDTTGVELFEREVIPALA